MDAAEHTHLTKLRCAYLKRLRVLELKRAKMGLDLPEYSFIEIDELSEKIAAIDAQLNGSGILLSSVDFSPTVQIDIVFKGDFEALTPELRERMVRVLAALVDLPPEQIRVVKVMSGSIIFRVELPKDAADRLLELYKSQDPAIEDIEISGIRTVSVSVGIDSALREQELADLQLRCAAVVAALNVESGWGLNADEQRNYCAVLLPILPENCSDAELSAIVRRYHLDHVMVESLKDPGQEQHDSNWQAWTSQVLSILRRTVISLPDDVSVNIDELVQAVRGELARELPSFRYTSRFSTWSYSVIIRSTQRYLRDLRSQKRINVTEAVEQSSVVDLIDSILNAESDKRLAEVLWLWAFDDMRIEEIGRRMQISPSQVRLLLQRIQELLRLDPSI